MNLLLRETILEILNEDDRDESIDLVLRDRLADIFAEVLPVPDAEQLARAPVCPSFLADAHATRFGTAANDD